MTVVWVDYKETHMKMGANNCSALLAIVSIT